jgi:dolichol-phosphate mannosyltransferase
VVYGRRRRREGETALKQVSALVFYRLLRSIASVDIPADTGDFRLLSRRALDVLAAMPEQFRFIRGMVSWIGLRQEQILFDRAPRAGGRTKYRLRRMLGLAADAITSFSIAPLRLAWVLGGALGCVALVMLAHNVWLMLAGRPVSDGNALGAITTLIGSGQFLLLGIFGEYLGRMCLESKRRPLFVIDSVVGGIEGLSADDHRAVAVANENSAR